ncbi:HupE/UreJ family protein [Microbacterium sp. BWT-B31]|uniref:HupE/UreJ family protein n=1 Tax=Microbacterium sp. BWT-B31 TaxID=3232072 RepID=UPI0035287465
MHSGIRRRITAVLVAIGALVLFTPALAASAHGFSSVVYGDVAAGENGHVIVELELEYDLLVVSAADYEDEDPLYRDGTAAFEDGDPDEQEDALTAHSDAVLAYVGERFEVAAGAQSCPVEPAAPFAVTERDGVPYAVVTLDYACEPTGDGHVVTSTLFTDDEGYVTGTKTILTYEIDHQTGSAALEAAAPSFSTVQSTGERFVAFFGLGAEHLLTGIDHILFVLALIAGSRRFREIVLAATSFTVAHSVTFILAATGVVSVSARFVEPTIAISIAIVGSWHLWQLWREGRVAKDLTASSGPLGLDRPGWLRIGIVFLFGLVHGLGFAGALGIDEPWSWTLLWSLLVFNLGIEAVQLGIIAVAFPLLILLRRRLPKIGMWATGALAVAVSGFGLVWFVERLIGA